ncbi:LytTR family transcriptional regulator DNA-binding domain-containing protein [Neiella sp. HB171785]|uniref:LytTR family transcriptional regulator DNA-binding domain-containing protein n=1 Tax=Neiella litorisoli TaxID=2771431 RepID=A0A8J6UPD5_9GAMM|nr:LytTR family transcriptional regulator DNA-binding domain-containing protein [Neiella litorisoli]MBD1388067.1 LytTR family transcriptional regulator DNA-binding domain-containing protein [Neiella litorisoli]
MKSLRVILIDDEPLALQGLEYRLRAFPEIDVIAQCGNGYDGLNAIHKLRPDAVFLDIEMPELSGIDMIQMVHAELMPMVVFVTAFNQFAIDAFALHAIDYLLKPVCTERLQQAVSHLHSRQQQRDSQRHKQQLLQALCQYTGRSIFELDSDLEQGEQLCRYPSNLTIKDAGRDTVLLPCDDIDWIDAAGDYMCVHSNGDTHIMRSSMKALLEQLNPHVFKRIHRSTIVNVQRICKVTPHTNGERYISLIDGTCLKVSRSYKNVVSDFA